MASVEVDSNSAGVLVGQRYCTFGRVAVLGGLALVLLQWVELYLQACVDRPPWTEDGWIGETGD